MAYWLVNSGTVEEPWTGDLLRLYREWNAIQGPVQKFPDPHRPSKMRLGDILIHRAVGSPDRMGSLWRRSAPTCSGHATTRGGSGKSSADCCMSASTYRRLRYWPRSTRRMQEGSESSRGCRRRMANSLTASSPRPAFPGPSAEETQSGSAMPLPAVPGTGTAPRRDTKHSFRQASGSRQMLAKLSGARPAGDRAPPLVSAGSARCTPAPMRCW